MKVNNRGMYIGKDLKDLPYGHLCLVVKSSGDNRRVAIQPDGQNRLLVIDRFNFLKLNNDTDYTIKTED